MRLPSAREIPTVGMDRPGSVPPSPKDPATLLMMTTAVAPTASASWALLTKVQVPRSISAMLPATCAPLTMDEQASLSTPTPSFTSTRSPVMPASVRPGPKPASTISMLEGKVPGELTVITGAPPRYCGAAKVVA
jgi:hypothetical protein